MIDALGNNPLICKIFIQISFFECGEGAISYDFLLIAFELNI